MKAVSQVAKVVGILLLFTACASSPKMADNIRPDEVVARIDGLHERPSWLKESDSFRVENGQVLSLGSASIPGDNRVEAAYRIAENNAKTAIASAIEQRLDFIFQNAEEGSAMDATQARYIGAEASKITTSSMRPDKRYWEKVASSNDGGQVTTQYKVFSLVKMPESDFKRAIIDAIRRQQGKGGLSAEFAKKVDQHWEQFVNPPRNPAANE